MTLFNYGECDMCKLHQSRKRDVMLDVLPADICCKVGEYFGCWRCEDMKEREQKYSEKYINCIKTYTKPEIQLHFLRYYKKKHFYQKHQLGVMVAKNFKMKLTEYLINQR
jgi:hypothetical protein